MQIDDLMQQMNLRGIVNSSNIHSHPDLTIALNITCSLLYAETDLIPNISDDAVLVPVVKQLNTATVKDSCLWLNDVVTELTAGRIRGRVACDRGVAHLDNTICKRWNSIQHFQTTRAHVIDLKMFHTTSQ